MNERYVVYACGYGEITIEPMVGDLLKQYSRLPDGTKIYRDIKGDLVLTILAKDEHEAKAIQDGLYFMQGVMHERPHGTFAELLPWAAAIQAYAETFIVPRIVHGC